MSDTKKKRGKSPDAIIAAVILNGVQILTDLNDKGQVSKDSVRKAMKTLAGASHQLAPAVSEWYRRTYGGPVSVLEVGETRRYKLSRSTLRTYPHVVLPIPDGVKGGFLEVTRQGDGKYQATVVFPRA